MLTEVNGNIPPIVFDHSFYASTITNSLVKPANLVMGRAYVRKATAFGTGIEVVAGVAIIGTATAVTSASIGK